MSTAAPSSQPQGAQIHRGPTTVRHSGFHTVDGTSARSRPGSSFFSAVLATAFFRCWHILIFFGAWSTLVTVLNAQGIKMQFQPTLLTVIGTVLGFVISYRTTSSFERYNEGRRLWSTIIYASRTFARTVWFHIPDAYPAAPTPTEAKRRSLIEKKTMINLVEAFAVAVKHYLRGEDGIYYNDLYYLVKFLPAYALPTGIPPYPDMGQAEHTEDPIDRELSEGKDYADGNSSGVKGGDSRPAEERKESFLYQRSNQSLVKSDEKIPLPVSTPQKRGKKGSDAPSSLGTPRFKIPGEMLEDPSAPLSPGARSGPDGKVVLSREDEKYLLPSSMAPKYHLFDIFPFNILAKLLTKKGRSVKGRRAARMRAKMRNNAISHNLPLEISLYLSSYISALQQRKVIDVPTTNQLLAALGLLVDALTGLERILTTPIPFSYSIHLWLVAIIYNLALPLQVYPTLKWVTIPASVIASFIFFGFLVAGEEIENPFGYDKNDLNLDHFTNNIIRNELLAITSSPPPDPTQWAFAPENDCLFASDYANDERVTPDQWLQRGVGEMLK